VIAAHRIGPAFLLGVILYVPAFGQQPQASAREAMLAAAEKQRAAIEVQKEASRAQRKAVRAQSPSAGTATAFDVLPGEIICEPLEPSAVEPMIEAAAKVENVDRELVEAVVAQESGYKACAVSPKGALGLVQLMPATAAELNVQDAFDPRQNIDAGVKFLKQLIERYRGDISLALAAYNAGPATIDEAGGIPNIPETQDYVAAILSKLAREPTPQKSK
jgi:soluble lytic murein transglycosylase-like protein